MSDAAPFSTQMAVLTRRLIDDAIAVPATLLVAFLFAIGFVITNDGLLGGSAAVAAEVGGNYLPFILPAGMLIASLASGTSGYLLAQDKEDFYLDRLLTMPVSRLVIVLTPVLLSAAYATLQASAILIAGALLGSPPATGVLGAAAMVVMAVTWSMGVAGYMTATALISGRSEVTRLADLLSFPLLFLSPLLLPQDQLQGWLQTVSVLNPTTYVLEGLRSLMIEGWQTASIAQGLVAAAAFAAVALCLATAAVRHEVKRG